MGDSSEDERIERIIGNEQQQQDDPDEGFESASNTSDIDDIVVGKKYPLPTRPRFHVMYSSDEEEEAEAARGGRRPYDRYPYAGRSVSRGDDDKDNRAAALRNLLRKTRTNGHGVSDKIVEAKRITGMAVKAQRIIYFVQWSNNGKENHPMDEQLMRWCYPELVIEFHEKKFLSPSKYMKIKN
ncbi:uncharacterized protein LOC111031612 [Myzus persicae]|uniref:uncharacterized protein LOC111031612 n=1 Tax=Myzus persicae TaxID=13164 RepID=UPI000B92FD61|nr:uncharacterized protein LOC111031612 [Myzus persicae]